MKSLKALDLMYVTCNGHDFDEIHEAMNYSR